MLVAVAGSNIAIRTKAVASFRFLVRDCANALRTARTCAWVILLMRVAFDVCSAPAPAFVSVALAPFDICLSLGVLSSMMTL